MSEKADCVIIGGGITGASIAYHLTKMGCTDVVLLEKDYLASKATSVCPGGIRSQWQDEAACLYAREAVKFFENLDEELHPDFPLPFYQTGYLFVAHKPETLEIFKKNVALQNRLDIPSEILSPDDIKKIVPEYHTEGVVGGSFCNKDGLTPMNPRCLSTLTETRSRDSESVTSCAATLPKPQRPVLP